MLPQLSSRRYCSCTWQVHQLAVTSQLYPGRQVVAGAHESRADAELRIQGLQNEFRARGGGRGGGVCVTE